MIMLEVELIMFETFWEKQVQPTGSEAFALPAWQAIHCAMHRGQLFSV